MPLRILIFLLFAKSFNGYGQDCDCLKNIQLAQQKVENNQASYQHQVVEMNRKNEYNAFKTDINEKAKKIKSKKDCIGLLSQYLAFFRDEHAFISYKDKFIPTSNKTLNPQEDQDLKKERFEGLWYFKDGSFSVKVFQYSTALGEWVATINEDKSNTWKKDQLKIEFFKNKNGTLSCVYWRKNLIPKTFAVSVNDTMMIIGRDLIFYRCKQKEQKVTDKNDSLSFEKLSKETNCLKIPSFELHYKNKIDSLILKHKTDLSSSKNLIIDLRNNGGGGFDAFQSLLPIVLDTNITEFPYSGSVWLSKDNYDYYDKTKFEFATSKQDSLNEQEYMDYLKTYINQFIPIEKSIDTINLLENAPQKIAIIFNRNTASSAEGFILQASSSSKVTTYGENSVGAITYGDWIPFELPDLNIWIAITSKKMIFNNNEDLESIGISPDINLSSENENDWLDIVLRMIEKE